MRSDLNLKTVVGEKLGPISKIINTSRVLTNTNSLYDAYKTLKNQKPKLENVQSSSTSSNSSQGNQGSSENRSVEADRSNLINNSSSRTSVSANEVLEKIYSELTELTKITDQIYKNTNLLTRNSIISLANQQLNDANDKSKMNEKALSSTNRNISPEDLWKNGKNNENNKIDKESNLAEDALAGVGGYKSLKWIKDLFSKKGAAETVAKGAGASTMSRVAPFASRLGAGTLGLAASPIVATGAAIVGTAFAIKEGLNWTLDFPDGPAKELFKRLLSRKKISWNGLSPKIEDVSYLRTLPKEEIQMLIDSGKFEGGQLGSLKQILKEPIVKTRVPVSQPQGKSRIISPNEIQTTKKSEAQKNTDENVLREKINSPIIAPDLQTQFTQTGPENEINTKEENPEINIPIVKPKEKDVNFGVMNIKSLTIEELILPEGTTLAGTQKDFVDNVEEAITKAWQKAKGGISNFIGETGEKIGNLFGGGDQRPPGYHDKIEGKAGKPLKEEQKAYYDKMYDSLYKAAKEKGIENPEAIAKLGATQTSLETGYGKHMVGNNAFGIKGKKDGDNINATTQEFENGQMVTKTQSFRKYNSPEESAADYIDFLQNNKRYKDVLKAKNVDEAIAAQAQTGYATDPEYGQKLANINATMDSTAPLKPEINHVIQSAKIDSNKKTESSGDLRIDAIRAQTPIQPEPNKIESMMKEMIQQNNTQQAPQVIQQPTSSKGQKAGINLSVRNDDPLLLSLQYGNLRTV